MALIDELTKLEYAAMIAAGDLAGIEATLNAKTITVLAPGKFITELGVLAILGPTDGEIFLAGIEAAAANMPVLNRVIRWLRAEKGVDVGNAEVQTVLGQLVADNVVTSESANKILAYGTRQISIAEQNNFGVVGRAIIKNTLSQMEN